MADLPAAVFRCCSLDTPSCSARIRRSKRPDRCRFRPQSLLALTRVRDSDREERFLRVATSVGKCIYIFIPSSEIAMESKANTLAVVKQFSERELESRKGSLRNAVRDSRDREIFLELSKEANRRGACKCLRASILRRSIPRRPRL